MKVLQNDSMFVTVSKHEKKLKVEKNAWERELFHRESIEKVFDNWKVLLPSGASLRLWFNSGNDGGERVTVNIYTRTPNAKFSDYFGSFCLTLAGEISGDNFIIYSSGMRIEEKYRDKGYSYVLHAMKEEIAKTHGIDIMVARVQADNLVAAKSMKRTRWRKVWLTNRGTDVWMKEIK